MIFDMGKNLAKFALVPGKIQSGSEMTRQIFTNVRECNKYFWGNVPKSLSKQERAARYAKHEVLVLEAIHRAYPEGRAYDGTIPFEYDSNYKQSVTEETHK